MAARTLYRVRFQKQELSFNAGETASFEQLLANELVARGHTAVDTLPTGLAPAKLTLPLKAAVHHGTLGPVADEADRQAIAAEFALLGGA